MKFVYVHLTWFIVWVALPVEPYPFGLLTMIVSLEAIFLSTFILISQNRADERRRRSPITNGSSSRRGTRRSTT